MVYDNRTWYKLIKKDNQGLERVAVQIDTNTNESQIMKVNEEDMNNLRLIAKRVQLEYSDSGQQQSGSYFPRESPNSYTANPTVHSNPAPENTSCKKPKIQVKKREDTPKRGYMGRTIRELINHYGARQNDGSRVYHSQAYTFVELSQSNNTSLLVYRSGADIAKSRNDPVVRIDNYHSENNPGTIKAWKISPQEKSIFIEMANSLNSGEKLPPINSDPTELRAALGSLSPLQSSPKRQSNSQRKSRELEL
ncbi:MAG: hypothetical protein KME40_33795 [Komarekiella atlantica HA4396-MV6]|nr:hypothetical protein [Komarekiella atlantica HA4396-MV6]